MAEAPKATEPARFKKVIRHEMEDGRQANGPWHSSAQDSQLETRKHTDPRASGRQTGWWFDDAPSPTTSALRVVRLNHSVPANWMIAAHQSIRWCCTLKSARTPPRCVRSMEEDALTVSKNTRKEAVVKKMDPMK